MATDYIKPKSRNDSRIANSNGVWQAICDEDVTGWDLNDEFIIALYVEDNVRGVVTEELRIEWQKDGGPWNQLQAAAGELRQGSGTVLVNGTSPISNIGSSGCDVPIGDSIEIEGAASATITCESKADVAEMVFAIDPSNAIGGSQYSFRLYSITGAEVIGDGTAWNAQITLAVGPQTHNVSLTDGFTHADTLTPTVVQAGATHNVSLQENLNHRDHLNLAQGRAKSLLDRYDLADVLALRINRRLTLTDYLNYRDILTSTSTSAVNLSLQDNYNLRDVVSYRYNPRVEVSFTDAYNIRDVIASKLTISLLLTEYLSHADLMTFPGISHTLTLVDALIYREQIRRSFAVPPPLRKFSSLARWLVRTTAERTEPRRVA